MDEKREKTFENLKKFFASDMRVKETLLRLAPTEKDDFNEESRSEYVDKLYKEVKDLEIEFSNIAKSFEFNPSVNEAIANFFNKSREGFLISKYKKGVIQQLYRKQLSDMNRELIEEVKEEFVGYTLFGGDLTQCINKSETINELLHVMHSYVTNNETLLQGIPEIDTKKNNEGYDITLYGEETELSRNLFENFPLEMSCGYTDIISMQDKILMMVRDRGHALTIDVDISKGDDILVKYFVPKICNQEMIEALPGIDKEAISDNGARGMIQTSKEELSDILIDFIEKVPTDADIPELKNFNKEEGSCELIQEETIEHYFAAEDAKELAMESSEKGRRSGALVKLQNALKETINKLQGKMTGKDFSKSGGNLDDRSTRD